MRGCMESHPLSCTHSPTLPQIILKSIPKLHVSLPFYPTGLLPIPNTIHIGLSTNSCLKFKNHH